MRGLGPFLRDAWRLARPYFHSEERWIARLLLFSIVVLNLMMVGMNVVLNFWNGAFYDSLQNKDWNAFFGLLFLYRRTPAGIMPGFCLIAVLYILVAVYSTYLTQWLQIRWRHWLTERYLGEWLADRAYYRISLTTKAGEGPDNPDQRIADDLNSFAGSSLSLSLDLLSNVVTLASFIGILWSLSGPLFIFGLNIPGYMVWVALVYAVLGTWVTHLVGRPLVWLNFRQQRVEADFRFSLARMRENVEGVALYGGEAEEKHGFLHVFGFVVENWYRIMDRTKLLNALTTGYSQIAIVFPIVVAAPRYFSGKIPLGGLTRTASAFGQVQGALSWFVGAYASLAAWRATVERLTTFHRAIETARAAAASTALVAGPAPGEALRLRDLTLKLPDGETLMAGVDLTITARHSVVVTGRTGSGKSTLFRAIAGIWPFGSGRVEWPAGRALFLPQRPYLPLGTLRKAVTYPEEPGRFDEATIRATLSEAGLANLLPRLDEEASWAQVLSGGEQQRLALARALLLRPDWLFLDEATASLDAESEAGLYRTLHERLPATTIVSITHSERVAALHERRLELVREEGGGRLAEPAVLAA
jgi:vitamin B12/bleomycin/antimicrobial peptide transport system ATP-binding/permease protein